jgi:hypothetical protein
MHQSAIQAAHGNPDFFLPHPSGKEEILSLQLQLRFYYAGARVFAPRRHNKYVKRLSEFVYTSKFPRAFIIF